MRPCLKPTNRRPSEGIALLIYTAIARYEYRHESVR
jgi:hypothetical protein